jgi:hypothetical protein
MNVSDEHAASVFRVLKECYVPNYPEYKDSKLLGDVRDKLGVNSVLFS